jgi:hypothetical protein
LPSRWTAQQWLQLAPAFGRQLASGILWLAGDPVEESLRHRSCFRRKRQGQHTMRSQGMCEAKGKTRSLPDEAHHPEGSSFGPESYE